MDISHLTTAFGAVVPMFCLMAVGVFVRASRLLTETELAHVNRMVFRVFFSIMMFYNLYTTNIAATFRPRLIVFTLAVLAFVYAAAFVIVCAFEKRAKRRGAMIQAVYRSNFVLMGIPMIANLFGDSEIAVTTMMVAIVVPIYNVLGVVTLEIFRGGRPAPARIAMNVVKNPMISGAILGLLFLLAGIPIPHPVMRALGQVTASTSTIALIILGASFRLGSTREHRGSLAVCVLSRLVLVPAFALGVAAYMGFRGMEFATLISIFATPCAVAGFAMAQQMDSDAPLAGSCVVFTSALSCFTLFGWILLFKWLGIL